MELDQDDIIKIIKFIDESTLNELNLEMADLKLLINKGENKPKTRESDLSLQRETGKNHLDTIPLPLRDEEMVRLIPSTAKDKMPGGKNSAPAAYDEEGLLPIKSPILGTFYTAPKPGAPPFVQIGTLVNEEDTICIIEVMKLFNSIKAGIRGRIKDILAKNGDMIECDQLLFLVQPE